MKKYIFFAFSILFLLVSAAAVFAQTEDLPLSVESTPLVATAELDSSGSPLETNSDFYIILNSDGTGLFYKDGYVSKLNWNQPDDNNIQIDDRLGYTYDGIISDGYLLIPVKDTTYLFEKSGKLPIMKLAPGQWAREIKPNFFVEDETIAAQIGEEKTAEINRKAASISQEYGIDIHIIIVSDFLEYSYSNNIELFSEEISDGYRLGDKNEENALLLVMSMADRDYDIYSSGFKTNEIFNPYSRSFLENAMLPHFKQNNWADGFLAYLDECEYLLVNAENGEIFEASTTTDTGSFFSNEERNYKLEIVISLIIGLLIGLIARSGVKAAYNNQVKQESAASNYIVDNSFKLSVKNDVFTHTTSSRTYSPRSSSSSSHSGGGGIRRSSHSSGKF
ncbi:MAG: TPM domain-containing protein [Spirochaetaceae bacterium]|nr:TPM domain-containing protein [Spirochaetaceae bacterium]